MYDVSIWEGIRSSVQPRIESLSRKIEAEIVIDSSLSEFRTEPLPSQFRSVLQQRAISWVERVYQICSQARDATGKPPSQEFDRSIWGYCLERWILGGPPGPGTYADSPLLNLLFCAVSGRRQAVPRNGLTLPQRDLCLGVRNEVWESWQAKLLGILSQRQQAAAAMVRFHGIEAQVQKLLAQATQQSTSSVSIPNLKSQATSLHMPAASPATQPMALTQVTDSPTTWEGVEITFISDHRVSIQIGKNLESLSYGEFGFADGRTGNPIEAWDTLRELAQKEGIIKNASHARGDWSRVEKHMQLIREILRTRFKISADPIPYVRKTGYHAAFKVRCAPSFRF
jgi:hypothetical protein